ncbi:MAG: type I phosphomannose isomerase catalytic subunit [Planctomycetota bacterium]|jgi:mannose-6-phosphate isomerase
MDFYPFKFRPVYKERIWGGHKLRDFFGKKIPEGKKIGESWEITDLPEGESVIANGQLAGLTLKSAIERYTEEIIGNKNFTGQFPLLIKFLDAEDLLSVQVHPDEQACQRMGKGNPKTECWYIISAAEGAVIYKGLKEGVTKAEFAGAIDKGEVETLLKCVPVVKGECHYLPAGTVHAIGAGLLIAEIQLPSDTTYRVFDWNRVNESGKPRELHIEEALESIHFDPSGDNLSVTTIGRVVNSKYFQIDKGHRLTRCELLLSPGKMKVMIILSGGGKISGTDSLEVEFRAGDTLLVPACYEGSTLFEEDTEYLTVTV